MTLGLEACRSGGPVVQQRYPQSTFVSREGELDGKKFRYRVYITPDLKPGERSPVMLYLHGAGNRGDDNESQLNGLADVIQRNRERINFIVVVPQCPADRFWDEQMINHAVKAMDDVVTEFHGDSDRLYVAGFSLGGFGVWSTAAMFPERFAAIVPMSGRVLPRLAEMKSVAPMVAELARSKEPYKAFAERLGNIPIWIFHGSADRVVAPDNSRRIAEGLKAAGSTNVRYSEIPNAGHEPLGFNEPELFSWLAEQRLSKR
ncbi:MAG: prolyl oligopeptidase family serine peptidase [Acidobacteria bacterium]|nr:prolyl oligopeptidase family serine peptidase [Acidobacteriota bacterium]